MRRKWAKEGMRSAVLADLFDSVEESLKMNDRVMHTTSPFCLSELPARVLLAHQVARIECISSVPFCEFAFY